MKQFDRNATMTSEYRPYCILVESKTIHELLDNINTKQRDGYRIKGDFAKTTFGFCQIMVDTRE